MLSRETLIGKALINPRTQNRTHYRPSVLRTICLLLYFGAFVHVNAEDNAAVPISPSPVDAELPRGVDKETGFRMGRYRAPVPDTNPGTEVVDTSRAFELHKTGAVVFIDVFPPRGLGADPLDGTWLTNETHETIENAVWLPEVGRGHVEQEHIDYFQRNLQLLTQQDKSVPLLFFCTADCWQSWNAARRALMWGYENIFWYPAGTDGWAEEGHSLVTAEPVNFFGEDNSDSQ